MIAEAEIRRLAERSGVDVMVQDLDHALGWFLAKPARLPKLVALTPFPPLRVIQGTDWVIGFHAALRMAGLSAVFAA